MIFKDNILIIIDDISKSGGTERVATFIANNFSILGKSVSILSLYGNGGRPYYPLSPNVCFKFLHSPTILELAKELKGHRSDNIISVSMGRLSFKLSILHYLINLKSKLILSEHIAYEISPWWIRALKRLSYHFADELVLLTQHDRSILDGKVKANVSVISNASAFPVQGTDSLEQKNKIVLAVGRLTYQKAFDRLLHIWAAIVDKNGWELRIIGDGEDRCKLQQIIDDNALADTVSLLPAAKNIDIEYTNASILAMTSHYEGLPLVLIESKSFGLPAIAFDCKTGPRELISDGVDGFLITDGDMEAYKDKLLYLMNSDDERKKMQLASLSAAERYSPEVIIKEWMRLL
ncbi:glycosyltransferase family 4 protein [Vibrio cholerae]